MFPGLSALDYENILRITVEYLIGWSRGDEANNPLAGFFGDVDAYCVATEEQGRKTLHGHILVWLRKWYQLWKSGGVSEGELKTAFERAIITYAKRVSTTKIFGENDRNCPNPCDDACARTSQGIDTMFGADEQGIRNLRTKNGRSGIDDSNRKAILKCGTCEQSYTSEDIAVSFLMQKFGANRIFTEAGRSTTH